jgi:hypothetical protein
MLLEGFFAVRVDQRYGKVALDHHGLAFFDFFQIGHNPAAVEMRQLGRDAVQGTQDGSRAKSNGRTFKNVLHKVK